MEDSVTDLTKDTVECLWVELFCKALVLLTNRAAL